MNRLMECIPLTLKDHPINWSNGLKVQLILDSSHKDVTENLPNVALYIPQIEKHSRTLAFALHIARIKLLDAREKPKDKPPTKLKMMRKSKDPKVQPQRPHF